jgi:3'-phosphoadenosine 5'-phosphosulfate sulfotransferase (PAPS reductase)/FAD synthetase
MLLTPKNRRAIEGKRIVASVSGGKDSAAMSLWLHENDIEHERVFNDTGWEHPDTYEYIRGELTRVIGPIREIQPERGFEDLVRHKGMFPSRLKRFCTQFLKIYPARDYLESLGGASINAVGIRAGESVARSKLFDWEPEPEMGLNVEIWRPLLGWTIDDVIAIHRRHGLRPNPLYLSGSSRVGCWPCIFARKAEIRHIADTDPATIDRIRKLEAEVGDAARARAEKKGLAFTNPPTMFQQSARNADGKRPCIPIDDVVKWSRTNRGGKQVELFYQPNEPGCVRWGLCEA